jgi:outer membrane lipase/esterase
MHIVTRAGLCLAAIAAASPAAAVRDTRQYPSLTVFGDSLVDAGNIAKLFPSQTPASEGYVAGRFTNGYDYTDLLSQSLFGTYTTASLNGGRNFAYGGARASTTSGVPDLTEQLGQYSLSGQAVDVNGLYVLNFGGNDIFGASGLPAAAQTPFLQNAATTYAQGVQFLNDRGARNILITGFPVATSALSYEAEGYLNTALDGLNLDSDTTLFRFSYLDFFTTVQTNPGALGLPPLAISPNCRAAGAQPDCTGLFYFDTVHPTAIVHEALFREVDRQFALTASIPEPETWLMMIGGFALAGAAVRRGRKPALA